MGRNALLSRGRTAMTMPRPMPQQAASAYPGISRARELPRDSSNRGSEFSRAVKTAAGPGKRSLSRTPRPSVRSVYAPSRKPMMRTVPAWPPAEERFFRALTAAAAAECSGERAVLESRARSARSYRDSVDWVITLFLAIHALGMG